MGNKVIGYSFKEESGNTPKNTYVDLSMRSKSFPGRQSDYKLDRIVDVKAVQNSIANLFNWLLGERILLPEYGSNLRTLLYRGITTETQQAIVAEIRQSISDWEPRVELHGVLDVSTVEDTERNTIKLSIVYGILGLEGEEFQYMYDANSVVS